MSSPQELKQLARAQTRTLLALAPSFHGLAQDEQYALYQDIVNARYNELAEQNGLSTQLAKDSKKASDRIDDARHENQRIDQVGDLAGDFIESVDFPGFVRDLLKGVFDANLEVTLQQMEAYTKLMKAATASISKFVREIDNTATFGYLVENSDEFSLELPPPDDPGQGAALTDKDGNVVARANEDIGDNQLKAKIMDAKIAMAQEQRASLRETILMGVTRLVVEKGTVKAAVVFDIKAKERIQKADRAASKNVTTSGGSFGGGVSIPFLGRLGGGTSKSTKEAEISISSAKSTSSTDLAAKITGSVEIIFKSDYFKLDNFAQMYGPVQQQQGQGQVQGQTQGGA